MRKRSRDCLECGFSLLELMVVIMMIGIMTALIIPEMRGTYEDALLRAASRKLVSVFNFASSRAVTLNQPHRVQIDARQHQFWVEGRGADRERGRAFAPLRLPGSKGQIDERIAIELLPPETMAEQHPPARKDTEDAAARRPETITFYPDATADETAIILRDREGFRLGLRVNPITARVQVMELERE